MPDAKPSRTYTMADWLKQASERTKPYLAFQATTRAEWEVWRHSLQTKLWQLMGPFPYRVALDPEVLERTPCDGYVREKVVFNSEDAASVPAWVLVPNQRPASGKFRTLLCLHGHNGGRAFGKDGPAGVTGDNPDKQKVITNDNYDYAVQFAKHGYLTIAPDSRGFGERFDAKPTYGHRDPCNVNFLATSCSATTCSRSTCSTTSPPWTTSSPGPTWTPTALAAWASPSAARARCGSPRSTNASRSPASAATSPPSRSTASRWTTSAARSIFRGCCATPTSPTSAASSPPARSSSSTASRTKASPSRPPAKPSPNSRRSMRSSASPRKWTWTSSKAATASAAEKPSTGSTSGWPEMVRLQDRSVW
ncbi:MAG: hypothetical protein FJ279_05145 [Planctomycetes bacterium]|nr:hypothetical protein [Planctomycetota bacterium]